MSTTVAPEEITTPTVRGRTAISSRAYEQLITALAADALAVAARAMSVRISDDGGQLRIELTGPIRAGSTPILQRIEEARSAVASRTTALTGASVERVQIHVTTVQYDEGRTR